MQKRCCNYMYRFAGNLTTFTKKSTINGSKQIYNNKLYSVDVVKAHNKIIMSTYRQVFLLMNESRKIHNKQYPFNIIIIHVDVLLLFKFLYLY